MKFIGTNELREAYLRFFESYLCVIIFYVVIVLIIERGQKYIERKVKNFY